MRCSGSRGEGPLARTARQPSGSRGLYGGPYHEGHTGGCDRRDICNLRRGSIVLATPVLSEQAKRFLRRRELNTLDVVRFSRAFDGCMVQGCQLQGFWWVHGPGVPTSGLLMGAWSGGGNLPWKLCTISGGSRGGVGGLNPSAFFLLVSLKISTVLPFLGPWTPLQEFPDPPIADKHPVTTCKRHFVFYCILQALSHNT